jgi:hypothetical protein
MIKKTQWQRFVQWLQYGDLDPALWYYDERAWDGMWGQPIGWCRRERPLVPTKECPTCHGHGQVRE